MSAQKITVTDFTVIDYSPKISNPAWEKYLPKTLFPKHVEFVLSGVSGAVSNGIRRTMAGELLVSAMNVEYEDIVTNDPFILPELLINRFKLIPVDQRTPLDTVFELNVTNTTPIQMDVKSSEIRIVPSRGHATGALKKLPFNETFTLFTLNPGKFIKITNIGMHKDYGFVEGYGAHVVAVNVASIPVDQKPINTFEEGGGGGIPSSISNPRVHKVKYTTNGTMQPKEIAVAACNNLIARVNSIQNLLYSIQSNGDEYILTVDGESDTIGNLLMRTICDLYPEIIAVTFSTSSVGRSLEIRIRCNEDINTIYNTTIKHLVRVFTDIRKFFE